MPEKYERNMKNVVKLSMAGDYIVTLDQCWFVVNDKKKKENTSDADYRNTKRNAGHFAQRRLEKIMTVV